MKRTSKASPRAVEAAVTESAAAPHPQLMVLQGQLPASSRNVKALAAVTALLREKGLLSLAPVKRPARPTGWRRG